MASDIREIKLAVLGDKRVGLPGLVQDMAEIKTWRTNMTLKMAAVSGAACGGVLGVKALITKILS